VALGLAIGAAATWFAFRDRSTAAPVARFAIPLPATAPFYFGTTSALAISPDGTRLIYRAREGNEARLYLRNLGQLSSAPIPGTEGAEAPAFSPDGRSVAFGANGKLKKVALDGGLPITLADSAFSLGIRWYHDAIYYVPYFAAGVWAIPESGGQSRQVLKIDPQKGARALLWPEVLPGGKTIIGTVWNNGSWDEAKIVAYPLRGGAPKVLIDGGTFARYVPTGQLLYTRAGTLYAVPFDAEKLQVSGAAVTVVSGVLSGVTNGEAHYAVSDTGSLLYSPGGVVEDKRSLLWIDRHGNEQPVVPTRRPYSSPAISPDGNTIALTLDTSTVDVWQLDIAPRRAHPCVAWW
jgi:serine/threonine-protein kinase